MFDPVLFAALMSSTAAFTPLSLFAAGEQGAWYDPSDFSTMFQDSAGTTPVTAVEQPVGLLLDKSKGLALGAELVTNGGFDSGTGWTLGSGWSITGGALSFDGSAVFANVSQAMSLVQNRTYLLTFTSIGTIAAIRMGGATAGSNVAANITGSGVKTFRVSCPGTDGTLYIVSQSTSAATIDNISVRELPGNHASQSTAASRPVLSARVNLLTYSENISVSPWSTLAQGTGVTPTRTANAGADPLGGNTATRLQLSRTGTGTGDRSGVNQTASSVSSGTDYVFSVFLKSYSGSTQKVVLFPNYGNGAGLEVTVTSAWQRFTVTANTLTGTTARVDISLGFVTSSETSADILVWGADLRVTNVGVNLPAYQRVAAATDYDTSGFPLYLKFDGTDDSLATGTIDPGAVDKAQVFAGVRKLSDAASGCVAELTVSADATNGGAAIFAPYGPAANFGYVSRGTTARATLSITYTAPLTVVVSGLSSISEDINLIRINGTQAASNVLDQGTGNYANAPLYIGRRGGTSGPFNGQLYSLIVRFSAANLSDAQIASTETWVNGKTGAY